MNGTKANESKAGSALVARFVEFITDGGGIPSAEALAQALADADIFDEYDLSSVARQGSAQHASFLVDDGDDEYEVIVRRRGPSRA